MGMTKRGLAAAFMLIPAWFAASRSSSSGTRDATEQKEEIERGRYLVEEVAKCAECHTPRNAQGDLDKNSWLQGAPIWILPVKPNPNWAQRAPALAGFPSLTEQEGERVLEKGIGPEGETLRPPMHVYHMRHEDAKAIIAYLSSLPRSIR
jgi:mono/diheme cytochrome c family protein